MNFKTILLLFVLSLAINSCSTDDDQSTSIAENTFVLTIEGEQYDLVNLTGQKSESTILISGDTDDGQSIDVLFHEEGNLEKISIYNNIDFSVETYSSAYFYSANTLNYDLLNVDEQNQMVSATFLGKLFEGFTQNENSDFIQVSGEFNVSYMEVTPQLSGLEFYAEINNTDWYGLKGYMSTDNSQYTSEWKFNETKYQIGFLYTPGNLEAGTYSFSDTNNVINMAFLVHTEDFDMIPYTTEGVVEIESVTSAFGFLRVVGTFSFSATNPNTGEIIEVRNGRINSLF